MAFAHALPCVKLNSTLNGNRSSRAKVRFVKRSTTRCTLQENTTTSSSTASVSERLKSETAFNWVDQWYALGFARDLEDDLPHAYTLFDQRLVMFRSGPGQFTTLDDECPHRLAPLSEGRLVPATSGKEDGRMEIECAYHGWCFESSGSCTCIPQLTSDSAYPRGASTRAYPTVVKLGLVWVWFGTPELADEMMIPIPPVVKDNDASDVILYTNWSRVVPYGFEALLENVADPTHVHWAHHKARPYFNRSHGKEGNDLKLTDIKDDGLRAKYKFLHLEYHAPATIVYQGITMNPVFTVTPISRRQSRLIMVEVFKPTKKIIKYILGVKPRWLQHTEVCTTTDGDNYLVREIERSLGPEVKWRRYTPIATDALVLGLRRWFDARRHSIPWQTNEQSGFDSNLSYNDCIERTVSHTSECKSCSGALKGFTLANTVLGAALNSVCVLILALAALAWYTTLVPAVSPPIPALVKTCLILLTIAAILWRTRKMCQWFIHQFTTSDEARRKLLLD